MIELREYIDESGRSLFGRWLGGLDSNASRRVRAALARLEAGNLSNVRGVGNGVLEYRIHFGPGYRVYFEGKEIAMPPTRRFSETVMELAERDPVFRDGLLKEAIECLLMGEIEPGKILLRDYINATIGFEELAARTEKPAKSLMRMFGPKGNPNARNLFDVIGCLQEHEGVHLEVHAVR